MDWFLYDKDIKKPNKQQQQRQQNKQTNKQNKTKKQANKKTTNELMSSVQLECFHSFQTFFSGYILARKLMFVKCSNSEFRDQN